MDDGEVGQKQKRIFFPRKLLIKNIYFYGFWPKTNIYKEEKEKYFYLTMYKKNLASLKIPTPPTLF